MHNISDDQIWRYNSTRARYTYYLAVFLNALFCNINRYDIPDGVLILAGKQDEHEVFAKNEVKPYNFSD